MFMFIGFKEFSIICVFLLLDDDYYPELAFIAVSRVKPHSPHGNEKKLGPLSGRFYPRIHLLGCTSTYNPSHAHVFCAFLCAYVGPNCSFTIQMLCSIPFRHSFLAGGRPMKGAKPDVDYLLTVLQTVSIPPVPVSLAGKCVVKFGMAEFQHGNVKWGAHGHKHL